MVCFHCKEWIAVYPLIKVRCSFLRDWVIERFDCEHYVSSDKSFDADRNGSVMNGIIKNKRR